MGLLGGLQGLLTYLLSLPDPPSRALKICFELLGRRGKFLGASRHV